jgi:hypothetical protein
MLKDPVTVSIGRREQSRSAPDPSQAQDDVHYGDGKPKTLTSIHPLCGVGDDYLFLLAQS